MSNNSSSEYYSYNKSLTNNKVTITINFDEELLTKLAKKNKEVDVAKTLDNHQLLKHIVDNFNLFDSLIKQHFGQPINYFFKRISLYPVFAKSNNKGFEMIDDKVEFNRFLLKETAFIIGYTDKTDLLISFFNLLVQEIIKSYTYKLQTSAQPLTAFEIKSDKNFDLVTIQILSDFVAEYILGNRLKGYEENERIKDDLPLFRALHQVFKSKNNRFLDILHYYYATPENFSYLSNNVKKRKENRKKYIVSIF